MSSRTGPRAAGSDGSDFHHRERVASHYRISAMYKSKMKYFVIASIVLCLTTVMRAVGSHLGLVKVVLPEGEGCFQAWEKFWLLSVIPSVLGLISLPKNNVTYMTLYGVGTMLFGVGGACWGASKLYPDIMKYIQTGKMTEQIFGVHASTLRFLILTVAMVVYAFGIFYANVLLSAWKSKGQKRE